MAAYIVVRSNGAQRARGEFKISYQYIDIDPEKHVEELPPMVEEITVPFFETMTFKYIVIAASAGLLMIICLCVCSW